MLKSRTIAVTMLLSRTIPRTVTLIRIRTTTDTNTRTRTQKKH